MEREEIEPHRTRHVSADAIVDLWSPPTTRLPIVIVRVEGHAREEIVTPIIGALEAAMKRGPFIAFDDWEHVTGYEPGARVRLTDWATRHGSSILETHILLASRLLSMGVSLATRAAALPVTVHASRADFERALRAQFPQYRSPVRRSA